MKQFSQAVCEKIGYYVYVLKDPRNSEIFYIGKGKGNRVFQHVSCALETEDESDKLNLIREILNEGKNVEYYILRHGLATEKEALEIESACIDLIGLDNLTNKVKGHNSWESGMKTADEIIQHYDAKAITITEPTIIININKLYKRFMKDNELYNTTRSSWKLGSKKNEAKYVIAAYRGLVREVYKINSWNQVGDRWEFTGEVAEKEIRDKYLNQSLENYTKKGSQNPIKYTY
jgi:hypothetical protein